MIPHRILYTSNSPSVILLTIVYSFNKAKHGFPIIPYLVPALQLDISHHTSSYLVFNSLPRFVRKNKPKRTKEIFDLDI